MAAWALAFLLLVGAEPDLKGALRRSGVKRSGLSVVVGRAGAAPLFALAPHTPRIPASNQKVLTAAAALRLLGDDYQFRTVVAKGPRGELVVVGAGDPNLSGRFFDGDPNRVLRLLARDVVRRGVKKARALVLDASRFDNVHVHPDWPADQLQRWYCAPVAALVFNDSCWDVTVHPGASEGAAARIEVQPALLRPAMSNRCATVARGHLVRLGRSPDLDLEVTGKILLTSKGVRGHVTVRDPVRFFGEAFLAALEAEGMDVAGGLRVGSVPDAKELVVYRSSLKRTLQVMLTNSQNLYAECVFKSLGDGSFESAGRAVVRALKLEEEDGLQVRDGSGLARTNRVTAMALYETLQAMRGSRVFVEALATGGTGTLRRRYKDLGATLRAKTGYIDGVRSLSGYCNGYVFVILSNGASFARSRRFQDLLVKALADA